MSCLRDSLQLARAGQTLNSGHSDPQLSIAVTFLKKTFLLSSLRSCKILSVMRIASIVNTHRNLILNKSAKTSTPFVSTKSQVAYIRHKK